jgi:hypothetical protein
MCCGESQYVSHIQCAFLLFVFDLKLNMININLPPCFFFFFFFFFFLNTVTLFESMQLSNCVQNCINC